MLDEKSASRPAQDRPSTAELQTHECPSCRCREQGEVDAFMDILFKDYGACSRCGESHNLKTYPDAHGKCPADYPDIGL